MMKQAGVLMLMLVGMFLVGCSSNTNTRIDYDRIAKNNAADKQEVKEDKGQLAGTVSNQALEEGKKVKVAKGEVKKEVGERIEKEVKVEVIPWPKGAWDLGSEEPHVVFGEPTYVRHNSKLMTVRKYRGFSVYYDGQAMGPRWTAIKLTAEMADAHGEVKRSSKFKSDKWLVRNGYEVSNHKDYNNEKGKRVWDRGHMVQFDDARGWGYDAGKDSFYTTNVWPQVGKLNQLAWLQLERICTEYARDYGVVWVFTGPVFKGEGKSMGSGFLPGRKVWKPDGFYKIVVRKSAGDKVEALAFYLPNVESRVKGMALSKYVVSVDEIEGMTGLDFMYELNDVVEDKVEAKRGPMWRDVKGKGKGF
ncbi:DNA/RNA non-specific endonuclease [Planctomycetota bacterium]|nr:DNA/RNA non-specific endonuclease [Planctomycetota bacterium]